MGLLDDMMLAGMEADDLRRAERTRRLVELQTLQDESKKLNTASMILGSIPVSKGGFQGLSELEKAVGS